MVMITEKKRVDISVFTYSIFSNKPNWGIVAVIFSCSADICTGGGSLKNESKSNHFEKIFWSKN